MGLYSGDAIFFLKYDSIISFGWDGMSLDSRSDSSSSEKGKGSRFFKKPVTGDMAGAIKKDFSKLGGITRNIGNTIHSAISSVNRKDQPEVVYSTGTRELGSDGYDVYNIEEGMEIFISKVSDSAIFEQDQQIVRATDGHFVGPTVKPVKVSNEQVKDGSSGPVDMHQLFKNVPFGGKRDQDIVGTVGVVQDGELVPTATPVNQVPTDPADVFNKMQRTHKVEYEEVSVLNEDGTVETVPAEAPMEEPVQAPVIETPVVESPVEEVPVEQKVIEEVPSVVDAPVEEPQVDSDFVIKTMPEAVDVPEAPVEIPAEVPAEAPVEEPIVEAPVETIVEEAPAVAVEAKPKDEFFIDSEPEASVEASAEEPVIEEVEIWKEDINLDVPETPAEAPVESPVEAVPALPKMEIGGLEVEGDSETNAAVAVGDSIAVQETEQAMTSADATPAPEHRPLDVEAKKEELAA